MGLVDPNGNQLSVPAPVAYDIDGFYFPASVIGSPDEGWDGSWWLDIRRTDILGPIMQARMKMCKDKGFDAIEPDEIDGYSNDTAFGMTYADQINYNIFIANMAHAMGMSIGLKGDIDQVKDLVGYFDWTLNEEWYLLTRVPGEEAPVAHEGLQRLEGLGPLECRRVDNRGECGIRFGAPLRAKAAQDFAVHDRSA
jgi:hypothetical protein